ncbi:MAG TPA: tripartite tricarboxylate transporter substrate binding protein [Eoetvoesiella sp.]
MLHSLFSKLSVYFALLILASTPAAHAASNFPERPVTIIVPFGAGGVGDLYARSLAQRLSETTKQSFIIDNRPGAGGVIGSQFAAKAVPDGYTILLMSNTQTANETLLKNKSYDLLRDFAPIAFINEAPQVLVVRNEFPAKTLPELIAYAKANPGKINYATSGIGTPYHIAAEQFKSKTDIDIVHIPYKSSGAARTDVAGGQVDMMFDSVSTIGSLIKGGKVRALATTGTARSPILPDVPTIAELGFPDYSATVWIGLMAVANTPQPVVDALAKSVTDAFLDKALREEWAATGATIREMNPKQFHEFLIDEIQSSKKTIESANISLNE